MRSIEVIVDAFAVNTDTADMATIQTIKPDYQHRILIGAGKTRGHGVAKLNELGAEIARDDADKIMDALRAAKGLYEADALWLSVRLQVVRVRCHSDYYQCTEGKICR